MTTVPKPSSMANAYTCKYDAWNRLVEVKSGATVTATYKYDGLNRRVSKGVTVSGNAVTYDDYYDASWRLLEERFYSGWVQQYVWSARYIDAPVCRLLSVPGFSTRQSYYLTDANMNVTALTDGSGNVSERCTYDPYGKASFFTLDEDGQWVSYGSSSPSSNEFLYCGYRRDSETGLYNVRNRMYHPLLGRWLQRDPLGYFNGMGLSEYCGGMPLGILDPSGLGWFDDLWNDVVVPTAQYAGNVVVGTAEVFGGPAGGPVSTPAAYSGRWTGRVLGVGISVAFATEGAVMEASGTGAVVVGVGLGQPEIAVPGAAVTVVGGAINAVGLYGLYNAFTLGPIPLPPGAGGTGGGSGGSGTGGKVPKTEKPYPGKGEQGSRVVPLARTSKAIRTTLNDS